MFLSLFKGIVGSAPGATCPVSLPWLLSRTTCLQSQAAPGCDQGPLFQDLKGVLLPYPSFHPETQTPLLCAHSWAGYPQLESQVLVGLI
jgi:hypothetical protein